MQKTSVIIGSSAAYILLALTKQRLQLDERVLRGRFIVEAVTTINALECAKVNVWQSTGR